METEDERMGRPPEVREALEVLRLRALAEGHGDYRLSDDRVAEVNSAAAVLTAHLDALQAEVERRHTDAESFRLVGDWIQAQRLADEDGRYGDLRQIRDDVYAEAKRLEQSQ